jgi:hypothetical protein
MFLAKRQYENKTIHAPIERCATTVEKGRKILG